MTTRAAFIGLALAGSCVTGCDSLLGMDELSLKDSAVPDGVVDDSSVSDSELPVDTGNAEPDAPSTDAELDAPSDGCVQNCAPPSCAGELMCNGESCCTSLLVPGGTFKRGYDAVTTGYTDPQFTATVSDLRLDKYEVTVGRFRNFVAAVVAGYRPPAGSGKHTHLNGGDGLSDGGLYETGWDEAWNAVLAADKATWDSVSHLACGSSQTWTPTRGTYENRPINCIDWHQAAAFCIWDGGFLPSEAEWNYAAAGGDEQRVYPWSSPPTSITFDSTHAVFSLPNAANVGSKSPIGNGRWNHADLAGNVREWTLDWHRSPYAEIPCDDCAQLDPVSNRVNRGGSFSGDVLYLTTSYRGNDSPTDRRTSVGVRCARAP
jgi:formylglycine-generating enzyme